MLCNNAYDYTWIGLKGCLGRKMYNLLSPNNPPITLFIFKPSSIFLRLPVASGVSPEGVQCSLGFYQNRDRVGKKFRVDKMQTMPRFYVMLFLPEILATCLPCTEMTLTTPGKGYGTHSIQNTLKVMSKVHSKITT